MSESASDAPRAALPTSFDLTLPSERMWPFTRRTRRVEIGFLVFGVLLGVFTLVSALTSLAKGPLSDYQIFDLSVLAYMSMFSSAMSLRWIPRRVRGAVSLRVDSTGFELRYPTGKHLLMPWTDPGLAFDLIDCRGLNPATLRLPEFPCSIRVRKRESTLTADAYQALLAQIELHQLVDSAGRGRWFYGAGGGPVIHRVRAAV